MKIKTSTISGIIANETNQMTPIPTQQLFEDLYVIQDSFANIFLIKDNKKFIAIDAGINPDQIKQELTKLGISADDVKTVLLTHSDIDHVNGLSAFNKAEIYLPKAEVAMLNNFRITMTETDFNAATQAYSDLNQDESMFGDDDYWPQDDMQITNHSPHQLISFMKNKINQSFKTIDDGEKFHFDQTSIEAVLIAGHTKGLTSYIVNQKYIFVSDGLSLQNGYIAPFNKFLTLDQEQHRKSISKIKNLKGFDYIFTQHYGYTGNIAKAFENWLD
jgi:glyoxylase-like metal-dependent hydrolase (beta-lactamase superfamily II)